MYDTNVFNVAPEQLSVAARREGILWLVIVKPGAAGRLPGDDSEKSIKVKSVLRGYEVEGESFWSTLRLCSTISSRRSGRRRIRRFDN